MIKLGTVGIISKAKLETTWIEILIHTGCIKPIWHRFHQDRLRSTFCIPKWFAFIVELTFELFCPNSLKEETAYAILPVAMADSDGVIKSVPFSEDRYGQCRQFVYWRRLNGWKTVFTIRLHPLGNPIWISRGFVGTQMHWASITLFLSPSCFQNRRSWSAYTWLLQPHRYQSHRKCLCYN